MLHNSDAGVLSHAGSPEALADLKAPLSGAVSVLLQFEQAPADIFGVLLLSFDLLSQKLRLHLCYFAFVFLAQLLQLCGLRGLLPGGFHILL